MRFIIIEILVYFFASIWMNNPQMNLINSFGLESEQKDDGMIEFDEIIFNLVCTGNSDLAKKFTRNYLKNFYKKGVSN